VQYIFLTVLVLVPFALVINHLISRYRYSAKSRTILFLLGLLSYLAAMGFLRFSFPDIEPAYIYLFAVALAMPVFAVLALAAVTYLRARLVGGFDQEIGRLNREREQLQSALTLIQQRAALISSRRRALEDRHREKLAEQRVLQRLLDEWQQAGGVARLRAVKAQEWRDELAGLSREAIGERRAAVQAELTRLQGEAIAPDRQDQLRAQLKVIDLVLLEPELSRPNEELAGLEKAESELELQRKDKEAELERVRHELEEWQSRRSDFLSRQITLG